MREIPSVDAISAGWLTERLRAAGHDGVDVHGFTATRIGTGQIGLCVRYALELRGRIDGVPRSLVGKFPSDDPTSRATGVQLRNYLKEVSFYRELKPRLAITTPRCYYAEIEGAGPSFALLLEDLAPAVQGDQLAGCDADVAHAAVLELVGLHAPSWNRSEYRGVEWIGDPDAAGRLQLGDLYRAMLPGFLDRFGARLAPDEAAIIAAVADTPAGPYAYGAGGPFALVHIDYRLDNLLIDRTVSPPRVAVVDWQSITIGNPVSDVAYFLGAGLLPEARRPVEAGIVRAYHEALQREGIAGYAWPDCWLDYRRGAFAGFGVTVIASMLVQQTVRGDEMFTAMARRHSRHALDLDSRDLLG
jgi:hypothetical protein